MQQEHKATLLELPAGKPVLTSLDNGGLARLAATCRALWCDAPTPPPPVLRAMGPVEMELRQRTTARGMDAGSSLPGGATSRVSCLLRRDRRDAQMRQAPLAVGAAHSIFVDKRGRLLTCGHGTVLGHAVDLADADSTFRQIGPPTPVPSMLDMRIDSVATGFLSLPRAQCRGQCLLVGRRCSPRLATATRMIGLCRAGSSR